MFFSLSPFAPEDLVSRDGFGSPAPRQPAHLHTQAEFGAYLRDSFRVPRRRPIIYCERIELLIDAASASEHRPRHSRGVLLACTDPSGERQRAPSTPRWGPSSLQRSFRRAIASSRKNDLGSASSLPACDRRRDLLRFACMTTNHANKRARVSAQNSRYEFATLQLSCRSTFESVKG